MWYNIAVTFFLRIQILNSIWWNIAITFFFTYYNIRFDLIKHNCNFVSHAVIIILVNHCLFYHTVRMIFLSRPLRKSNLCSWWFIKSRGRSKNGNTLFSHGVRIMTTTCICFLGVSLALEQLMDHPTCLGYSSTYYLNASWHFSHLSLSFHCKSALRAQRTFLGSTVACSRLFFSFLSRWHHCLWRRRRLVLRIRLKK